MARQMGVLQWQFIAGLAILAFGILGCATTPPPQASPKATEQIPPTAAQAANSAPNQQPAARPPRNRSQRPARDAAARPPRDSQPAQLPPHAPITKETAAAEIKEAKDSLRGLDPFPADIPAQTKNALRAKILSYRLEDKTFGLWEATARPDDFVKVDSGGFNAAAFITRGLIRLQPPAPQQSEGRPAPPAELMAKAKALSLFETSEPDEQIKKAQEVHAQGKLYSAAPTGERLLTWGPETVGRLAKSTDVFIIQAERWLVEDQTPDKKEFLKNVLANAKVIRAANPQCKILIELGRRLDRGGGTADQWIHALALLYAADPNSFDGFYPFITRQPTPDPKQGYGALRQTVAWLRGDAAK